MSNRTLPLMLGFVAVLVIAVVALLGVLLLSSGGGDDGAPASDDGSTPTPSSTTSEGFCKDNVLIIDPLSPPQTLDPIQVTDVGSAEFVVEIYGGLVTLDLDLQVVGDLAETWDISPDGKVYTFHLRDNAVFHNGRRVTADDVKYSIERAADPAEASPTVLAYLGAIEGLADRYGNRADDVSGVQVIDESTVEITLNSARDWFIEELTYPVSYVVDETQITGDPRGWVRQPNATGPFRVLENDPGRLIVLGRNDRYHLGPPKLEKINFELAGGSILARYENNEIHVGGISYLQLDALRAGTSELSADYHPSPQMSLSYLTFNVNEAPFDDLNVRKAFAMTVNREAINDQFFEPYRVADGIIPPEMPGYDEDVAALPYDPEEARRLLAASKYAGDMPRIVLTYIGDSTVLEPMQQVWKQELGVDVELQAVDFATKQRLTQRGEFQIVDDGWIADYPDPENFVDKLFAPDSSLNKSGYSNTEVQDLLEEARSESDREQRFALLTEAEQIILDDAILVPTFWSLDHKLIKQCVKNYPSVELPVPIYRYIEIDPTAAP